MAIIWLASFPKSGNTWVRALFSAYLYDEPVSINRLHGTPIAASRVLLERNVGVDTDQLPDAEVEALRPAAYINLSKKYDRRGEPAFIKVHDAWKLTNRNQPLFPRRITHGAVYIARHPFDVAVSLSHHLGLDIGRITEMMCREDFSLFSVGEGGKEKSQVKQILGSWKTHVTSWLDAPGMDVHLVKYEDLHADAEKAFAGILAANGYAVDQARLQRAVRSCRFPALQAQELVERFKERSKKGDAPFFREGKVGSHKAELPAGCADRLWEYNAPAMVRLGYSR
jgi:hypothetical protein